MRRRRTAPAVVQVDHCPVEIERALNLAPVRLVLRDFRGTSRTRHLLGAEHLPKGLRPHRRQRQACTDHRRDERATAGHGLLRWVAPGSYLWVSLFAIRYSSP